MIIIIITTVFCLFLWRLYRSLSERPRPFEERRVVPTTRYSLVCEHLPPCLSDIVSEYERRLTTQDAIKTYIILASMAHCKVSIIKQYIKRFNQYRTSFIYGYARADEVERWLSAGGRSSFFWPNINTPHLFTEMWIRGRKPRRTGRQRFTPRYLVSSNGGYIVMRKCRKCSNLFWATGAMCEECL